MKAYICVVYDGINNSVFQSQVVAPLLACKAKEPELAIHIVSFEKNVILDIPKTSAITFHIFKRYPFIHHFMLLPNIIRLRRLLHSFKSYQLLARGPFAGYIAYHASGNTCKNIIIQARGLAAEEYAYSLSCAKRTFLQQLRYACLLNLEKKIYGTQKSNLSFQAVSPELKAYLCTAFSTKPASITLASHDIPSSLCSELRTLYRNDIRSKLHIDENAIVFCYSGSYKPWQYPQETITFFKSRQRDDPHCLLLILTPDFMLFSSALHHAGVPAYAYRICSVSQNELFAYLSAADFGLLLREHHIINTVSRPTKALEYQAAGLTILHNDTVPYVSGLAHAQSVYKES